MSLNVDVQVTVSALGYVEDGRYMKEPDCFESVRDLIRFLKHDSLESCPVRRQLCSSRVIENDLIPILRTYHDDPTLFDVTLRLLINLTQPPEMCFGPNAVSSRDKATMPLYMELLDSLRKAKHSFADDKLLALFARRLNDFIECDWEDRQEEDRLIMERILILARNVLYIPPSSIDRKRTDTDETSSDRLLESIHSSGLEDVLLLIAGNNSETHFHIRVLEIISLMLREHIPTDVAMAGQIKNAEEKRIQQQKFEHLRQQDEAKRRAANRRLSSRPTNFGGTYVVRGLKAIDGKSDVVCDRMISKTTHLPHLEERKAPKRTPKNRRTAQKPDIEHRSTYSFRLKMRKFCCVVLDNCYNSLMRSCRPLLGQRRNDLPQSSLRQDDANYLRVMCFFMEFRRAAHLPFTKVKETMSVNSFHYVQTQIDNCLDMLTTDKTEATAWGQRGALAMAAYKELLLTLQSMDKDEEEQVRAESKAVKDHIFYVVEYRDLCLSILKKYQSHFLSKDFLRDLISATHIYLRMLEKYCQGGSMTVMTRRKKPRRRRKRQNVQEQEESNENELSEDHLEEIWEAQSQDLCDALQGHTELRDDLVPFDATMQIDEDAHRRVAMSRIQSALRQRRPDDAVSLYRAARNVWPQDDIFGSMDIEPENEFMELKEIMFAHIESAEQQPSDPPSVDDDLFANEMGEEEEFEEEEEESQYVEKETEFIFVDYLARFARADVLKWYIWLLGDFDKNSKDLNHMLVKLMYRVMSEMSAAPLLYQIELFRTLQRVGHSDYRNMEAVTEAREFGKRLLRQFFEDAKSNHKIFLEMLFWKGKREAYELQQGYGSFQNRPSHNAPVWPEELEDEVRNIYAEYQEMEDKPEGLDVADYIESFLTQPRTKKQIVRKMREFGFDISGTRLFNKAKPKENPWPEELDMELRNLVEQFRGMEDRPSDQQDVADFVASNLSRERGRRQVLRRFKTLDLAVEDLMKIKSSKATLWTDVLLTELQSLYEDYLMLPQEERPKNKDVADYVVQNLSESKSRRLVVAQMEALGLDVSDLRQIRKRPKKPSLSGTPPRSPSPDEPPSDWADTLLREVNKSFEAPSPPARPTKKRRVVVSSDEDE